MRIAAVILVICSAVYAQSGGYRLFDRAGERAVDPGGLIYTIDPRRTVDPAARQIEPLKALVIQSVTAAERIVRRPQPSAATSAQQAVIAVDRRRQLDAEFEHLPGRAVRAVMTVRDVIARPKPIKPPAPAADAPLEVKQLYEQQLRDYHRRLDEYPNARFVIVGELDWTAPSIYTPAQRQAVREAYDRATEAQARLTSPPEYKTSKSKPTPKEEALADVNKTLIQLLRGEEPDDGKGDGSSSSSSSKSTPAPNALSPTAERTAELVAIRQAAEDRVPRHFVYCLSGDEQVIRWQRGQRRIVQGRINTVAVYIEPPPRERGSASSDDDLMQYAHVGLEFEIELLREMSKEQIAEDEAKAKETMTLARNFAKAGRIDLARKYCQLVIDNFPDSTQADEARQWLAALDAAPAQPGAPQ